jgi:hypothetical protein
MGPGACQFSIQDAYPVTVEIFIQTSEGQGLTKLTQSVYIEFGSESHSRVCTDYPLGVTQPMTVSLEVNERAEMWGGRCDKSGGKQHFIRKDSAGNAMSIDGSESESMRIGRNADIKVELLCSEYRVLSRAVPLTP